jgi:translation initiation factor IF-3
LAEDGGQLGVLSVEEALQKAKEAGVDLVEISPDAAPPVCKLIDFGKFIYQKEKKEKEARKKQKIVEIKEMKFRPKIDHHDFEYRMKQIKEFLEKGDKVKITIRFRGRELVHVEIGSQLMNRIVDGLKELGIPEKKPKMEGKSIVVVISPAKK